MLSRFISASYCCCVGILVASCGACAQNASFLPHKDFFVGPACCLVAAGDFDGDGKTDFVVSYGSPPSVPLIRTAVIALMRGDGKGGLKPPETIATFNQVISHLVASDVNLDGKLDLLVQAEFGIYLFLGKGDGSFETPSTISVGGAGLVLVADFNGDGIPDLQTGCAIALGNGDGTFRPPLPSSCSGPTEGVAYNSVAADLDGDGNLDVVWGSVDIGVFVGVNVWVALGNGDGTLRAFHPIPIGRGYGGMPVAVADLNHDGKPDLVVSRSGGLRVLLGNGDGTFQQSAIIQVFEGPVFNYDDPGIVGSWFLGNDIFVADFDGDGNPDIMVDNALLLGNGDGTFQPPLVFAVGAPQATLIFAGDLNGDGKPDLVVIPGYDFNFIQGGFNEGGGGLSVLLNNSPGPSRPVLGVSAVTGSGLLAPASIGSIYGNNLAKTTSSAVGTELPTQLGGISLRVRDSRDVVRLAPLYYVSPGQINFLVPADTPTGLVTLAIDDGSPAVAESTHATVVNDVSPGFFAANGVPAASAIRIRPDGSQESISVFNCAAGQCALNPIDLSKGPLYLSLFGTGFRFSSMRFYLPPPMCEVGGVTATVQFFGAQPTIPGVDQINVLLPPSLPRGQLTVQCEFIGSGSDTFYPTATNGHFPSNPVKIAVQ